MGRRARRKRARPADERLDLKLLQRRLAETLPDYALEAIAVPTLPEELMAGMTRAITKSKKGQQPMVVLAHVTGDAVLLFGVLDLGAMLAEGFPELSPARVTG